MTRRILKYDVMGRIDDSDIDNVESSITNLRSGLEKQGLSQTLEIQKVKFVMNSVEIEANIKNSLIDIISDKIMEIVMASIGNGRIVVNRN